MTTLLKWTGLEDTLAIVKKGEPKAEFAVGKTVECDDECAKKLMKFDKRFVVVEAQSQAQTQEETQEEPEAKPQAEAEQPKPQAKPKAQSQAQTQA